MDNKEKEDLKRQKKATKYQFANLYISEGITGGETEQHHIITNNSTNILSRD